MKILYLVQLHKLLSHVRSKALPEITYGNNVSEHVYHNIIKAANLSQELLLGGCHPGTVVHIVLSAALSAS